MTPWTAVNSEGYPAPAALAVDTVVLTVREGRLAALAIRGDGGLLEEALPGRGVLVQLRRHDLHGGHAVEPAVARAVHDAHPAPADHGLDAVSCEDGAEHLNSPVGYGQSD